jgi:nicotinamidase-related amidase
MTTPTLMVIDVHERNVVRAIEGWRERGAPLIHVRHESEGLFAPGSETAEFKPEALPPGFETWLLEDATATYERRARDGEPIPAKTMHRTAIASLNEEFAAVLGTDEALGRAFGG